MEETTCEITEVSGTQHEGIYLYETGCGKEFCSDSGECFLYCPFCAKLALTEEEDDE